MEINKDIRDLIVEYANRYYRYEKDFYKKNTIKMSDNTWQRFKQENEYIEKMYARRVNNMIDDLFTDFEQALIGKAQLEYYFGNEYKFSMTFPTFYDKFKKDLFRNWLENHRQDVIGGKERLYDADGNQTTNYLLVALESSKLSGSDNYMLELRFKDYSKGEECPAGRENRLKWFEKNLGEIR